MWTRQVLGNSEVPGEFHLDDGVEGVVDVLERRDSLLDIDGDRAGWHIDKRGIADAGGLVDQLHRPSVQVVAVFLGFDHDAIRRRCDRVARLEQWIGGLANNDVHPVINGSRLQSLESDIVVRSEERDAGPGTRCRGGVASDRVGNTDSPKTIVPINGSSQDDVRSPFFGRRS